MNLKDVKVKIRKPHHCEFCGDKHEPPTEMKYMVNIHDGDFNHYYMCEVCDAFMDADRWRDYGYEFRPFTANDDPDYKPFKEQFKITANEHTTPNT